MEVMTMVGFPGIQFSLVIFSGQAGPWNLFSKSFALVACFFWGGFCLNANGFQTGGIFGWFYFGWALCSKMHLRVSLWEAVLRLHGGVETPTSPKLWYPGFIAWLVRTREGEGGGVKPFWKKRAPSKASFRRKTAPFKETSQSSENGTHVSRNHDLWEKE